MLRPYETRLHTFALTTMTRLTINVFLPTC